MGSAREADSETAVQKNKALGLFSAKFVKCKASVKGAPRSSASVLLHPVRLVFHRMPLVSRVYDVVILPGDPNVM